MQELVGLQAAPRRAHEAQPHYGVVSHHRLPRLGPTRVGERVGGAAAGQWGGGTFRHCHGIVIPGGKRRGGQPGQEQPSRQGSPWLRWVYVSGFK
jgi:hypothetical protein